MSVLFSIYVVLRLVSLLDSNYVFLDDGLPPDCYHVHRCVSQLLSVYTDVYLSCYPCTQMCTSAIVYAVLSGVIMHVCM